MKKILILFVVLIVGVVAGVYHYLDFLAQHAIEKYGSEALGVKISVKDVKVSLHDEQFTIKGIKIQNPKGYNNSSAIQVASLKTNIDFRTILKDTIVIRSVTIDNPSIFYSIGPAGDNIKALRSNVSKQSKSDKSSGSSSSKAPKKIIIHKFFLNKAKVHASVENIADKSLTLPDIYIQNIGKDSNGVTVENAAKQIFRELSKAISRVNIKSLIKDINNLPNNLDDIKSQVEDKIDSLKKGIEKLF